MVDIFLFSLCQLNITSIIHGTPKIDETGKFWLLKNFNKHLLNHNLLWNSEQYYKIEYEYRELRYFIL